MKATLHGLLVLTFLLLPRIHYAQNWVEMMEDPKVNFYEVQKEFNKQFAEKERTFFENAKADKDDKTAEQEEDPIGGGWVRFKRWEDWSEKNLYPTGDRMPAGFIPNEFVRYKNQYILSGGVPLGNWTEIGPRVIPSGFLGGSGRLSCIAFHPSDPKIIFVGACDGGIWKSTNGGASWSTNTDTLASLAISDIVFDPVDPTIMWAAGGDPDHNDAYGIGLLKSTDGGNTWSRSSINLTQSQTTFIAKILINPLDNKTMVIAGNAGIKLSKDAGVTWKTVSTGIYKDLEYKPGDPTVVYASTAKGFYRSSDGGNTFTAITSGIAAGTDRLEIAVTPNDPNIVYVVAGVNSNFSALYLSTDAGLNFSKVNMTSTTNISNATTQSWYGSPLVVSPTDKNTLYYGNLDVCKSTDGGKSWTTISSWNQSGNKYAHSDHHRFAFYPGDPTKIYSICDGGIFLYDQTKWTDLSASIGTAQMYNTGNSAKTKSLSITGWQDNGTNLVNNGKWSKIYDGDGMKCFIDYSNDKTMYRLGPNGSWGQRSIDGGATWKAIGTISEGGGWVTPFKQDPKTANTIYLGAVNLWKSTNQGTNWSSISSFSYTNKINNFAVAPSNSNVIFVAANGGINLMKTSDGGTSWKDVSAGLPVASAKINGIAILPGDPNTVFVSFLGYSNGNKIFKTTDGGTTWTNITYSLPNIPASDLVYYQSSNPLNSGLFVGMDAGVYYLPDKGSDWIMYNNNLANAKVTMVEVFYNSGGLDYLRASTFGRGLWETPLDFTTGIDKNFKSTAVQYSIYPNPSSGTFNLKFYLDTKDNYQIAITNVIGQTIYQERLNQFSGAYTKSFDLSSQAKGIYLISVTSTAAPVIIDKIIIE